MATLPFRPSAGAQEGLPCNAPSVWSDLYQHRQWLPRCCAGATVPFHQGLIDEKVKIRSTGAGCLHSAYHSGHYGFNAN